MQPPSRQATDPSAPPPFSLGLSLRRFRPRPLGFSRAESQRERSAAPPVGSWGHGPALDSCPPSSLFPKSALVRAVPTAPCVGFVDQGASAPSVPPGRRRHPTPVSDAISLAQNGCSHPPAAVEETLVFSRPRQLDPTPHQRIVVALFHFPNDSNPLL